MCALIFTLAPNKLALVHHSFKLISIRYSRRHVSWLDFWLILPPSLRIVHWCNKSKQTKRKCSRQTLQSFARNGSTTTPASLYQSKGPIKRLLRISRIWPSYGSVAILNNKLLLQIVINFPFSKRDNSHTRHSSCVVEVFTNKHSRFRTTIRGSHSVVLDRILDTQRCRKPRDDG